MDKLNIPYKFSTSAVLDIKDINSSFAKGSLKVMYLGKNKNKTLFSKSAVCRAIDTLKNVPIVCNWIYEDGIIGGHDMDFITDSKDRSRLVNLTDPCGVVPEHASCRFATEIDEDGVEREYLVVDDVILWKRQDVFKHISEDLNGSVNHSMEINILSRKTTSEGFIDITDFEFTALCLLERDKPCFSGSKLTMYSIDNENERYKLKFEEMMSELNELKEVEQKETQTDASNEVQNKSLTKGGSVVENEQVINVEDMSTNTNDTTPVAFATGSGDISITDNSMSDEVSDKTDISDEVVEGDKTAEAEPDSENEKPTGEFSLERGFREELETALSSEVVSYEWGDVPKYIFVDYDKDISEVYAWDSADWLLYGFSFITNGDSITVDFDTKKRKKYAIVDFNDENQESPFAQICSKLVEVIEESKEETQAESVKLNEELTALRKFKLDTETAATNEAKQNIIERFSDLRGNEAFEGIVAEAEKYDIATLEEKCYAIRGRISSMKFSAETKAPKTIIERPNYESGDTEPYGGIVEKFKMN